MLVSHLYKYIYFKTQKTAGTSTEVKLQYDSALDQDRGYFDDADVADEAVTENGIVGWRMSGKAIGTFYNHMSCSELLTELGEEKFFSYHKIANVRNPWDKVLSLFFWKMKIEKDKFESEAKLLPLLEDFIHSAQLYREVDLEITDPKYQIQTFIRYENLNEDLSKVIAQLQIPNQYPLRNFKSEFRPEATRNYRKYYSVAARDKVASIYDGWIRAGRYNF